MREKVFGAGRAIPLDGNAKARIAAYARAWSARNKRPGQHRGPITRTFQEVLRALLWGFHNGQSGACFPSLAAIAAKAECNRATVVAAIKALEFAGVLIVQNRIVRIREQCVDLFGRSAWRWRMVRTSNAYAFRDPACKSENPAGTQSLNTSRIMSVVSRDVAAPLSFALVSLGAAISSRVALNKGGN